MLLLNHAFASDGPCFSSCASFVSHTFHQIVLPYKFRSLTFRHNQSFATAVIPIPKFREAINAGDAHALSLVGLVQELDLHGINYSNNGLEKVLYGAISFRNLTKLSIVNFNAADYPAIMEQLGKFVQSLHICRRGCLGMRKEYGDKVSYGALSNI